jgi:hypothetical protein
VDRVRTGPSEGQRQAGTEDGDTKPHSGAF